MENGSKKLYRYTDRLRQLSDLRNCFLLPTHGARLSLISGLNLFRLGAASQPPGDSAVMGAGALAVAAEAESAVGTVSRGVSRGRWACNCAANTPHALLRDNAIPFSHS